MYSMTGYGKGVSKRDGKTITIEIKTVNHRFWIAISNFHATFCLLKTE